MRVRQCFQTFCMALNHYTGFVIQLKQYEARLGYNAKKKPVLMYCNYLSDEVGLHLATLHRSRARNHGSSCAHSSAEGDDKSAASADGVDLAGVIGVVHGTYSVFGARVA